MVMIRIRARLLCVLLAAVVSGFAQRGPIDQQLTFAPHHTSGIYDVGETAGWTVTPGPVAPTYAYKWTIRRNNAEVLKQGKLDLSSGKDKIEITGDQPAMIYVAIEPYANLTPQAPMQYALPAPTPPQDAATLTASGATTSQTTFVSGN